MENTSYSHLSPIIGISIAVLLSIGCITIPKNLSKDWVPPVKHRTSAPVEAFALVQLEVSAVPTSCTGAKNEEDCDKILSELPSASGAGSGSGMLVNSDLGPAVLTAAHVCEHDFPDQFEHDGITVTIMTATKITLKVPTKGVYTADIIRLDREKDLCLLRPSSVFTNPVPIAQNEPKMGDVVYSIGAPYGIAGAQMALIFRGFFSGVDKLTPAGQTVRFYTIPTRPGSSGSAVFNKNWEVVGVVHTAFRTLENVGLGTGLNDLKTFLFSPVEVEIITEQTDDGL